MSCCLESLLEGDGRGNVWEGRQLGGQGRGQRGEAWSCVRLLRGSLEARRQQLLSLLLEDSLEALEEGAGEGRIVFPDQ